jgi:hypothetical protein
MKILQKMLMVVLMLIIPVSTILAQADKGDKEFSTAVSFSSLKSGDDGGSSSCLHLFGRFGYFITKNVEIEPEVTVGLFMGDGDSELAYNLSLNLSYNFTPDKKTVPFLLAGAGISNTIWLLNIPNVAIPLFWGDEAETFKILNAGVGIKTFLSKRVAFRAEYRFQYFFVNDEWSKFYYHQFLVGISVFLKK